MMLARGIPLTNRGGVIVAFTLVDPEDFARFGHLRCNLSSWGYARHGDELLHRLILGLRYGDGLTVDHINRDKLDNRKANLRLVTGNGNARNRGSNRGSASRYRNVYWEKGPKRWRARVKVNGVRHNIGSFATEIEAARAAAKYRALIWPDNPEPHPELLEAVA